MNALYRISPFAVAVALALSGAACGGNKEEPRVPKAGPTAAPAPTTYQPPAGTEIGISDAPTSGEASNRPKMNAAAKQAYVAGLQAFQGGDLQGAKAQFQKATEADPRAYQAYYSLGVVKERLGEGGALTAYGKAVSVVPDYEPAIYAYGVLLARQGKTSEATEYLNSKAAKMPKSAAVPAALAEVKSIEGDSGQAQQLAREALKKNPDYRPAMVTIARDHYRKRRLDLALYSLKAILDGFGTENPARDSNNAESRLIRGLIYKEQNNRKGAIDEFQRALTARPDLVEARVHLAVYHLEAGNASEAAMLLEKALQYDKAHLLAHLNLGDAYRMLGKSADSKKHLEWVLAKDPSLAQVHYNLGVLYLVADSIPGMTPKQQADKAISELEKFKEMMPRGKGGPDDTDELITRAKTKKGILEAEATKPKPAPAATGGTTKPAGSAPAGTTPPPAGTGGATKSLPPAGGGTSGSGSTKSLPPAGGK
jgi:Tfp pilus assembly protein PilF